MSAIVIILTAKKNNLGWKDVKKAVPRGSDRQREEASQGGWKKDGLRRSIRLPYECFRKGECLRVKQFLSLRLVKYLPSS